VEYLNDYLVFTLPINVVEIFAAIAGTIFLKKVPAYNLSTKYFVRFLWLTVAVETIGTYAPLAYFEGYQFFSFLENSSFLDNKWLYNSFAVVTSIFYTYYFGQFIKSKIQRVILKLLAVLFVISSIVNLAISGVFFIEDSEYVYLVGTFLVFFSITLFYFELLKSDMLLNLKRYLPFYISIGVLVFSLCMTPISLFSEYFNQENSEFVKLQSHLILYSNLFMYTFFIIGFYICRIRTTYS
jgi:hypothetical protein